MIGNDHRNDPPGGDITVTEPHESKSGFAPLTLDLERYAKHFDGLEISEADRNALLEALWSIMVAFVDLGFDVKQTNSFLPDIFNIDASFEENMVDCCDTKKEFETRKDGA